MSQRYPKGGEPWLVVMPESPFDPLGTRQLRRRDAMWPKEGWRADRKLRKAHNRLSAKVRRARAA